MNLTGRQNGVVGDMTASRKVKVPTVSEDELQELIRENQPIPTQLGNSLYLEWFSEANGRVVIEAAHYQCEISAPEWSMNGDQENEQRAQNQENLQDFLQQLVNEQSFLEITEEEEEAEALDEFEWERLLRKSDEVTDEYLEALEKFREDPECDKRVAEEMGWDWLLEEGDLPADNPLFDFVKEATGGLLENSDSFSTEEESEPTPDAEHPLALRACELASEIFRISEERGLLKNRDPSMLSLVTCANTTATRLSGALGSISEDGGTDYGFVIATLKRALTPLHQAIAAATRIIDRDPGEADWLHHSRAELFQVRQEVLTLMKDFRDALNGM